jgi:hypothetical protein
MTKTKKQKENEEQEQAEKCYQIIEDIIKVSRIVLHNNNIVPLYHTFSNVSLFYM